MAIIQVELALEASFGLLMGIGILASLALFVLMIINLPRYPK